MGLVCRSDQSKFSIAVPEEKRRSLHFAFHPSDEDLSLGPRLRSGRDDRARDA